VSTKSFGTHPQGDAAEKFSEVCDEHREISLEGRGLDGINRQNRKQERMSAKRFLIATSQRSRRLSRLPLHPRPQLLWADRASILLGPDPSFRVWLCEGEDALEHA
jgi:hypothetical protein